MNNDLKVYRLKNGMLIVGKDNGGNIITDCMLIVQVPIQQGKIQNTFQPLLAPVSNKLVSISKEEILCESDCPDDAKQAYTQQNSNITIPKAGDTQNIINMHNNQRVR